MAHPPRMRKAAAPVSPQPKSRERKSLSNAAYRVKVEERRAKEREKAMRETANRHAKGGGGW